MILATGPINFKLPIERQSKNSNRRQDVRDTRKSLRAFTLFELIMVLFVIGVVLAISAPALRGYFASRQTGDLAANVLTLTKFARTTAISSGAVCRMNVDPQSGEYWLTLQHGGEFVPVDGEMGKHFSSPEGTTVTLHRDSEQARTTGNTPVQAGQSMGLTGPHRSVDGDASKSYLQFYPTGRCDTGTIEIAGPQGDTYFVTSPSATESYRVILPTEAT